MKLPVIFLGHGSPLNAIKPTTYASQWQTLGKNLRLRYGNQIRAVLMISAHWVTDGTFIQASKQPELIYDFYGFPQELYDFNYPVKGHPQLATAIAQLSDDIQTTESWGVDHGAWSVLAHVFPEADIPVLQLSLNKKLSMQQHFQLAQQLSTLREQGVLIMASGNVIHNLRYLDWQHAEQAGSGFEWAESIRHWVNQKILEGNFDALIDKSQYPSPDFQLATATPDHWWPLLYCLGAADSTQSVQIFNDDIVGRSLSMTSFIFGAENLV